MTPDEERKYAERQPKDVRCYSLDGMSRVCTGEAWLDMRNELVFFDVTGADESRQIILGYRRLKGDPKYSGEPAITTFAEFREHFTL